MDAGPEAVHSGDVKPYEGSGQKKEPFRKDPLLFMQKWLVMRKKGQDFLQTMMGKIRRGRRIVGAEGDGLGRLDDEEQKVKNDSKGDDFVETSKEGEGEDVEILDRVPEWADGDNDEAGEAHNEWAEDEEL